MGQICGQLMGFPPAPSSIPVGLLIFLVGMAAWGVSVVEIDKYTSISVDMYAATLACFPPYVPQYNNRSLC